VIGPQSLPQPPDATSVSARIHHPFLIIISYYLPSIVSIHSSRHTPRHSSPLLHHSGGCPTLPSPTMSQPQQPIQHNDSMSTDNVSEDKKKTKSRRPPSAFYCLSDISWLADYDHSRYRLSSTTTARLAVCFSASRQRIQQKLTFPRPILTPKTVLPLFFVIGIVFSPIGGLLLWANSQVRLCSHRTESNR
jgi:hypothetical protein